MRITEAMMIASAIEVNNFQFGAIQTLIEAAKKQEPMKPVNSDITYDNYGETFYEYTCHLCEAPIDVGGIMGYKPNYCENCGQKLNWED